MDGLFKFSCCGMVVKVLCYLMFIWCKMCVLFLEVFMILFKFIDVFFVFGIIFLLDKVLW